MLSWAARARFRTLVAALVPSFGGWRTFPRAFLNLLSFGIAIVTSVWLVHQTEYSIEYGSRFHVIMQATPHRFYMEKEGIFLGILLLAAVVIAVYGLRRMGARRSALLARLPVRMLRHARGPHWSISLRAMFWTATVLFVCQIAFYLAQENLESAAMVGRWPGLSVLLAPQHATVVPLHLVSAVCASMLLWLISARVHSSEGALTVARFLVRLTHGDNRSSHVPVAPSDCLPVHARRVGARSPRAPPLAA